MPCKRSFTHVAHMVSFHASVLAAVLQSLGGVSQSIFIAAWVSLSDLVIPYCCQRSLLLLMWLLSQNGILLCTPARFFLNWTRLLTLVLSRNIYVCAEYVLSSNYC